MAKLISVGKRKRRTPSINLFCEDCEAYWIAAKFPISVSTLEAISKSRCINCYSENVSVIEDSLEDPNNVT